MKVFRKYFYWHPHNSLFLEKEDLNPSTTVMVSKATTGTTITSLVETSTCARDGHCKINPSQNLRTELAGAEAGTKT